MTEKDEQFFEEHWEEWVRRNPPPEFVGEWKSAKRAWARLEMPCRGFIGRFLFWLGTILKK